MRDEKLLSSFIIRFVEKRNQRLVMLQNLKTGERLEFESWLSAWCYLEDFLAAAKLK